MKFKYGIVFGKNKKLILNKCEEKRRSLFPNVLAGQWNQILAGFLCCVGFSFIFGLMIYLTVKAVGSNENDNVNSSVTNAYNARSTTRAQCITNICAAICSNGVEGLATVLEEHFNNAYCPTGIVLVIKEVTFPNQTIHKNWLCNSSVKIFQLQLEWLQIDEIEPGAFTDPVFRNTKFLYIGFCKLLHIREHAFDGLDDLIEFNMWDSSITSIEKNAFSGLSNNIVYLSLRNCKIDVESLLEDVNFPKLLTLVLSSTSIPKITTSTFNRLKMCSTLIMEYCNIDEIEPGSFNSMNNLMRLHIENNNLKNLPENLLTYTKIQRLFIKGNDWQCTCYINWIKELILIENDFGSTFCNEPHEARYHLFSEVDFCEMPYISTTTTPLSTTHSTQSSFPVTTVTDNCNNSSSTEPPTSDQEKFININCSSLAGGVENIFASYNVSNHKAAFSETPSIKINENNVLETVTVEANPTISLFDVLLWYEIYEDFSSVTNLTKILKCLVHITSDSVDIKDLEPGKMYMICLLRNRNSYVYPFDCKPHLVELPWSKKAWLQEKDKPTALILVIVMTIICCLCGAGFVYAIIRRNPILLRGSKRVVMVRNNETKAIVLPPKSTNEYKNNIKECEQKGAKQSLENKRINFKRSVSETSIVSSKSATVSYVSALEPTPVQLLHWRLERLRGGVGALMETSDLPSPLSSPPSFPTLQVNN